MSIQITDISFIPITNVLFSFYRKAKVTYFHKTQTYLKAFFLLLCYYRKTRFDKLCALFRLFKLYYFVATSKRDGHLSLSRSYKGGKILILLVIREKTTIFPTSPHLACRLLNWLHISIFEFGTLNRDLIIL